MTFEETKQLLRMLARKRKRVDAIQERINTYQSDYGAIQSILSGEIVGGGEFHSKVEILAERVLIEQEKLVKALDEYFKIEDTIAEAINDLSPEENEVIVEFYMQGYSDRKIARLMNYDERTIKRRKRQAIIKISKKL